MTEIIKTGNPSAVPIIYVHAKGSDRASNTQIQDLQELGYPLCSRLANDGLVKTVHGFDRPGMLLAELERVYPGRPVIFLRAGLQPSKQVLDQLLLLLESTDDPLVLTLLSNAETTVNPFTGLQAPANDIDYDLGELIKLLAPGQIHTLTSWTDHFALLSSKAVKCLAQGRASSTLMQRLTAAEGALKVADHLFLHDVSRKVFEPLKLHPHESPQPPPFSELSARLQDWCNAGITKLPYRKIPQRPATLHITHSWGGGVASWLKSFVNADNRRVHFQLRSEEAKAGRDYGQKLSLYARNELRCPIASWWLQPPIPSVVDCDAGYKEILADICRRYGIGRIFVSSLIGHSLDALRSGLPTVQILHDHFPVWPLLSVNPQPYLLDDGGVDLEKALEEQRKSLKFRDKDAAAWLQIRRAYVEALIGFKVKIAVPGHWVLALQSRLEPAFMELTSKVIPHGFPAMAGLNPVFPKPRKDGRLRMVILGRMQAGKGQKLLSRALPGLTDHVQVYLLGTGKSGEAFFGCPGVDVVLEYDRDKLGSLLATIGPDFAALLSVVPETYSYTLSELRHLQIPAIATRVGSFPDRIEHGKTGWLVDTDADALIRQVTALCRSPGQIESVRRNLPGKKASSPRQMASAYNNFCPLPKKALPFRLAESRPEMIQWAAADYRRSLAGIELRRALKEQKQLTREVARRSEWAHKTSKELKAEQQRREQWVAQLNGEIDRLKTELDNRTEWAQKTDEQLKLERARGRKWLKQNQKLSKEVETRTEWAHKTSKELKAEQQRREQWVGQLNGEIDRLKTELDSRTEWAQKTDEQLKLERARGRKWLKQNKKLSKEVETRTEWAHKTSKELKAEQQRREQWVGQLNGEIDRLKTELDNRTEWAQKTDEQLKLERARGRKWLKQNQKLSKEVETRTEWAQKTGAELIVEQQRREQWVAQLNGEIDRLKTELDNRTEWAQKTDEQLKLERARGRKWLKQNKKLSKEVETRTEWAQKTGAELKVEQQRREQWVGQLNGEIDRLKTELDNRTEWAQKTDEQLKLERARGRKWLKQNKKLSKEVETRTEWAQKTGAELKVEQQRREQWVAQLNGEIDRLKTELDNRTEWAQKTDEQLKLERARGRKWLKQNQKLSKEVESRTEWAQKTGAELKVEQQRREQWVAQLNGEIDRLKTELDSRTEWALATNRELELEQQRREKWVAQLESEISRLQSTMTDQQAELENKNLELEKIQVELGKFLEILEDRQARLDGQQKQLDDTRTELGTKERELQDARIELGNRQAALESLQTDFGNTRTALEHSHSRFARLESDYQQVLDLNALILQSSSWKITRPLRALRRVGKNFMLARAWNPLRWPWLFSHLVKNLATLGFSGTIRRLQDTGTEAIPEPDVIVEKEAIFVLDAPEVFKYYDHPDASIVIPVYNKWEYTSACLNSLVENKGQYTFEVIVVDDQSSDETPQELAQTGGIKYIRNEQNLGFVSSCNRGAKHARGEFLIRLNNDTQVTDGWLDELIDTFRQEPEAGLVGSRLVYPDGRLQESGGMIFKDGSGWNYGREQEAEQPDYLFLRESDYCSGACIALPTGFFHQLGGFDERYAPAYYEDTDLAFRVREYGLKVFIQPMSVVIHHEGVTSGTDTSSGTKKYQLINQEKFLQRWWAQLQKQPQPISDPQDLRMVRNAIHHRCKGRILFVDATTPEPDQDSGSVRLTNLLKICRALGYDVTFFADNRAYRGRYTRDLQKAGIEVLYNPWLDALQEFFEDRGREYDYVFISRHYIAINYLKLLKRYCPNAHFIFDTVDLHYLREQRLAELEKSKTLKATARQTRRSELSVIKAADATLVVSSVEQTVLAEDAPGNKVHVLSNIHHVPGRGKGFAERQDIYFVGGYQHPPNIDAACWFVNDIWPLIHQQLPDMRFHLIGSKAPDQVSSLHGDGVIFHGFVETLEPFLNDCRLAVAPLRYGAGVKGKVNMSMAHGQPMVATSVAGEGMFAEHGREFLLADDAESFAAEVVRLYQDEALWYRLSDASIKNVKEHFSVKAARNSLISLLDSLTKK